MKRTPKRRPGRPVGTGKAPGEKYAIWGIRFPPEELEAFRAAVPPGERAEFARAAIREKLARREAGEQ